MNKLRIAVAAMVIAVGSIGAFAFTKAKTEVKEAEAKATTYYAIRIPDTDQFRWTSDISELEDLECLPLTGASCTVSTTSQPGNNQNPDPTPDNVAYQTP